MTRLDRSQAAQLFIEVAAVEAYDAAIRTVTTDLEGNGLSDRSPREGRTDLQGWFQCLDQAQRAQVLEVARRAANCAVFFFLVILDGCKGGYPIPGVLSEFAVYLQTYADLEHQKDNSPQETVRVDPSITASYDLHDLFTWFLEDRAVGQAPSATPD